MLTTVCKRRLVAPVFTCLTLAGGLQQATIPVCPAANPRERRATTFSKEQDKSSQTVFVSSSPQKGDAFKAVLLSLAERGHIAILVEGGPPPNLSDEKVKPVAEIVARFLKGEGDAPTLDEVLQKTAAAYDYEVVPKSGVFTLRKCYTEPDSVVCVTLEEWRASIDDAARLAGHFSPSKTGHMSKQLDFTLLVASFTPEQTSLLAQQGLAVSALAPSQKAYLNNASLFVYLGHRTANLINAAAHAHCLQDEKTLFGWFRYYNNTLFGYYGPLRTAARPPGEEPLMDLRPLSHPTQFRVTIGNATSVETDGPTGTVTIADDSKDPTRPTPFPPGSVITAPPPPPATLQTVTVALNARRAAIIAPDGFTLVVDPALQDKELLVIAERYASPGALFDAMGELYGLLVRTDTKAKTITLARHHLQIPTTMAGIADEMRRVLPAPFLRAVRTHAEGSWRIAASRRLRESVEPVLAARKEKRIPLRYVDQAGRVALANIMMADALKPVNELCRDVPVYLTNPDPLFLTCRPYKEKETLNGVEREAEWLGVQFGVRRANGTMAPYFTYDVRREAVDKIKAGKP